MAAAMTACKEKRTRYCVDDNNAVVNEDWCRDEQRGPHYFAHHWYYGGARGFVAPGTRISGGSTTMPAEGFATPAESGTSRGVIGRAGEAAAGHAGGEGGGHGGGGGE
jgi:hypothetical protein